MASNAISVGFALGDVEFLERLPNEIREILLDTDEVFRRTVRPFLHEHVKKVFQQQGDPTGTSWAGYENEPKYGQYKSAVLDMADPEDRLMRWREIDGMEELLQPSLVKENHRLNIWEIDGLSAVFGTRVGYAERLAQEGGVNPFGESYPPRPILQMSSRQKQALDQGIEQTYDDMFREEGLNLL
jgi:hypothetical protein